MIKIAKSEGVKLVFDRDEIQASKVIETLMITRYVSFSGNVPIQQSISCVFINVNLGIWFYFMLDNGDRVFVIELLLTHFFGKLERVIGVKFQTRNENSSKKCSRLLYVPTRIQSLTLQSHLLSNET